MTFQIVRSSQLQNSWLPKNYIEDVQTFEPKKSLSDLMGDLERANEEANKGMQELFELMKKYNLCK